MMILLFPNDDDFYEEMCLLWHQLIIELRLLYRPSIIPP